MQVTVHELPKALTLLRNVTTRAVVTTLMGRIAGWKGCGMVTRPH